MSFGGNRRWVPRLMDEKIGKQAPFTSQPTSHVTPPHVQVALSSYFSPSMNLTLEILYRGCGLKSAEIHSTLKGLCHGSPVHFV